MIHVPLDETQFVVIHNILKEAVAQLGEDPEVIAQVEKDEEARHGFELIKHAKKPFDAIAHQKGLLG